MPEAHRLETSSAHVEDVVVARAVLAALLRHHHELISSPLEEEAVLRMQAVHSRALRECDKGHGGSLWRLGVRRPEGEGNSRVRARMVSTYAFVCKSDSENACCVIDAGKQE